MAVGTKSDAVPHKEARKADVISATRLKKPPIGGIKVATVKKAPVQSQSISSSSSSVHSQPYVRNALPEVTRLRIEEMRKEKERKRQIEDETAAKAKKNQRKEDQKRGSKERQGDLSHKRKKARKGSDDEGDLFTASDSSSASRSRKHGSSRSTPQAPSSQGYKKLGRLGVAPHYHVPRNLIDEEAFERGSFNSGASGAIQSAQLIRGNVYRPFFQGLDDDPRIRLEYPACGASEEFVLLVPKDRDEYDPISDLLRTVRCIVEFYLTPEEQSAFGSLDSLETSSAAGNPLNIHGRSSTSSTPAPALASGSSRESTPAAPTQETILSKSHTIGSPLSPVRSAVLANALSAASENGNIDKDSILRSFTKARNRRDGPLFLRAIERFNDALKSLKDAGKIRDNVRELCKQGVPEGIWRSIQEQCYARAVGPRVEELSKYEAFSDNVYGELLPKFMSEIAQLTSLGPSSVFMDLGSGVGNLLIQVALQTGSQACGCEQMPVPSELAALQVNEAIARWKMWGLRGSSVETWQGDFGDNEKVRDTLRDADVVLVNNYAFTAPTNDKLSWLFLDLKDGAQIVSLKPFVPADFRLTERTLSSPLAILRVAQRQYSSGCVSWADGGGRYYIHVSKIRLKIFLAERPPSDC